jgi:NADP-dependent 3-hydroxy acid dehydrogenase YdfG
MRGKPKSARSASDVVSPVVVSGATGALGSVIVERLVRADVPVIALARSQDALDNLGARFPGIRRIACDLRRDSPVIDESRISGVVHAAGAAFGGGVLDVEPAAILEAIDLKVNGLLRLIRSVDNGLVEGSRIIALGGNLGLDPVAGASVPGVTNAALANLIRQLSRAYAPRQVTAHLISPGPVDTERLRLRAADEARVSGSSATEIYTGYAAASPLSRLTTPAEVAWAVQLLFDPEAVALAGSTLFLDSGLRTSIP